MLKRSIFYLFFLVIGQAPVSAQEAPPPSPEGPAATREAEKTTQLEFYPSNSIIIQGLLREKTSFTAYLLITSNSPASLDVGAVLKDEAQGLLLPSASLILPASPIVVEAGKPKEVPVTVSNVEQAGHYKGQLQFSRKDGQSWSLPMEVHLREPWEADIYEEDKAPVINTASASLLNGMLPRRIRQPGINLRIDNKGSENLAISNISLALKGEKTNAPFTSRIVSLDSATLGLEIPPEGLETLWFTFRKELNQLPADSYKGEMRIYFKGFEAPLSANVTVNKRIGALGAILLLFLGIVLGRWIKDLNKAKGQLELMERFVPLRAKVDQLTDTIAQKQLLDEVEALEQEINTVFSDEAKAEVEAKFPPIEKKVAQIRELEALVARLEERIEELELDEDQIETIHQMAASKVRLVRDTVLAGQEEEAKAALEGLAKFLEDPTEGRSRSVTGDVLSLLNKFMEPILKKISEPAVAEGGEEKQQPGQLQRAVFWLLNFLSGVKVSARLRYGLMRPVITLATFVVILLLGFNEIYINGGDTFGSEGIMDYLKLFLWGIISDVFSRSLTDIEAVKSFMK